MLTVLTVDLAKGLKPVDSIGVMTDARIVYASQGNLYLATERWAERPLPATPTKPQQQDVTTAIHRFDISDPDRTRYRGSGQVSGYLLNQWSLSENAGILRVVSTDAPAWFSTSDSTTASSLTTLRLNPGELDQVGRVGNLGKGDRVYAVRFVGSTAYVVTFKQVDPLYTIDVSDPTRPQVLGELELPGYSAYLHPIGSDLLLGIGEEVGANNEPTGTQFSLFDVSDLRHPTRLAHASLGQSWSAAESDHHAFLFWPPTGLVVVPFFPRAVGYRVDRAHGLQLVGRITQPAAGNAAITRSVVVGGSVFTISDAGVASNSLAALAPQGWAAFPAPEVQPVPTPVPVPGKP